MGTATGCKHQQYFWVPISNLQRPSKIMQGTQKRGRAVIESDDED